MAPTPPSLRLPAAAEDEPAVMPARAPAVRLNDYYEVYQPADPQRAQREGKRCMNCGAAFCMPDSGYAPGHGCPLHNKIPEWNELVRLDRWREAYQRLLETNPFPEFTSRVCPAPCEEACIHGIHERPVQIKGVERAITDRAFDEGWAQPHRPAASTGRHVGIIGSGPAGLAAADALIKRGRRVTVYERSDRPGGLLIYGVPNMKLDKAVVNRRIDLLERSGVRFVCQAEVGVNLDPQVLRRRHDALLIACGALRPRDLDLPGRDLPGVIQAMDYLTGSTRGLLDGRAGDADPQLETRGRDVVVIGGGDTGADCIATALRQGCRSLINITRRPQPPATRDADHPWPGPPGTYTLDYAHAEGVARHGRDPRAFEVEPLAFRPDPRTGRVGAVRVRRLDRDAVEDLPAQRVILAVGFTGHDAQPLARAFDLPGRRGRLDAGDYRTGQPGIYAAGDCRRGPSLVVWAIREGRDAGAAIHNDLQRGVGTNTTRPPATDREASAAVW